MSASIDLMLANTSLTIDRPWIGYGAVLAVGALLGLAVAGAWSRDQQSALQHYREKSAAETRSVAEKLEDSLRSIYQNIRTLSLLPSVQTVDRHATNLSAEARVTFQQIYNNLASSVSVSEVYILPAELHPHRLDLTTGRPQEPILMFDELIVNAREKYLQSNPAGQAEALPAVPEVEIFEYEQMETQLAWLKVNYPIWNAGKGLAVPMVSGPELITCDNTFYLHTMNDADRAGIVFIVPFYDIDGAMRGGVAAIILTHALEALLPGPDFALVNTKSAYAAFQDRGQAALSRGHVNGGEAEPELLYSEVVPLETGDVQGQWAVWAGHPDSAFYASAEAEQLRTTAAIAIAAISLLTAAGLIVWFLVLRNMRASASIGETLERKVAERTAEIQFLATHDALTRLANRVQLSARMDEALDRLGDSLAVLAVDLDHFKAVNDTLGHPTGDKLLAEVAARLRDTVGEHDVVARLGGDEFVIASTDLSSPLQAELLARRCIDALSLPYELNGHTVRIGASIGIAIAPADGGSSEQLLRNADIALYRAKDDGRGTCRFFEAAMDASLQERKRLEADLHQALERHELSIHYMPLVTANDASLTGFEALVRWNHPTRGMLAPDEFISVAEDTGLIHAMGEWILRQACQDAVNWPAHLKVAVNISAVQFKQQTLAHTVVAALDVSGLSPTRLELEITESALLFNNKQTLQTLHQIRALGVRVAMDDFGTGFSSLSYLRSFPFDRIKIDRSFVAEIEKSSDSRAIVDAVVALGRSLGMTTTAEGIENDTQLQMLKAQGCTDMQGFYFGKAMPASAVLNLLQGSELSAGIPASTTRPYDQRA